MRILFNGEAGSIFLQSFHKSLPAWLESIFYVVV